MIQVQGKVVQGHGVASGKAGNRRFPDGTLAMQKPYFQQLGLDLAGFYLGTINLAIAPYQYHIRQAKHVFRNVRWSLTEPAEDFSFLDCRIAGRAGLIYYPHPDTKPEHFQAPDVLEILTTWIEGLQYGDTLLLEVDAAQMAITLNNECGGSA
jgi:hypothetical protein